MYKRQLLTFAGIYILNLPKEVAFIAGMGFTLSSTAIVMQVLEERGITNTPKGQRVISTLIFEDLSIVPLLASIAVSYTHLRSGSWIFPDTNGARTPIVKMIIPILTPYCSSIGMYLDNKVCCMINSTAAEMVIALFWPVSYTHLPLLTIKKTMHNHLATTNIA